MKATRGLPILIGLALSFSPSGATAQQDLDSRVDGIFAAMRTGEVPGCSVAAARDGKPLVRRAYGLADLELKVPATPDSIYEAGSSSKQFAAAAIVLLARDSKLNLDDDVRKYLPELQDYGTPVTLRHMLHHTSGLRDWGSVAGIQGWPRNSRVANNQHVLEIAARQKVLNFTPGAHFLYSNTNFNLLAIVVQRVSGQSLADFTQARIFKPLGMTRTSWRDDHDRLVPGRAKAYRRTSAGYANDQVIEDAYGNGGLLTTVGDLLLWNQALDSDRFGPGFTAEMERRGKLNGGDEIAYGAGLFHARFHGLDEVAHGGVTGGYRAWLGRYPAKHVSVAILCNNGGGDTADLGRKVASLFLPPETEAAAPAAAQAFPAGIYVSDASPSPLVFRATANGPEVEGYPKGWLKPLESGLWRMGGDRLRVEQDRLVLDTTGGEHLSYRKVMPATLRQPESYAGSFRNDENDVRLAISGSANGLVLTGIGQEKLSIAPSYGDVFTGNSYVVEFVKDGSGAVTGFKLSDSRSYNMMFEREGR